MEASIPSLGNSLSRGQYLLLTRREKCQVNLRKSNLEALLNGLKNLLVLISGNEGDSKTLGTETTSTTDAMEVRVGISGEIVVDGEVDAFDIDTTAEDVSGDADTLVEFLEFLVTTDTIRYSQ